MVQELPFAVDVGRRHLGLDIEIVMQPGGIDAFAQSEGRQILIFAVPAVGIVGVEPEDQQMAGLEALDRKSVV